MYKTKLTTEKRLYLYGSLSLFLVLIGLGVCPIIGILIWLGIGFLLFQQ